MKRKKIALFSILFLLLAALLLYPLDTYISKPGGAYELSPLVEVEGGDMNDAGSFSLMTVAVSKATPLTYGVASISHYQKLMPAERIRRSGEDDAQYKIRQKRLMSTSQMNAIKVAFDRVGIPVNEKFNGVYIMHVMKNSAADGLLQPGDIITKVDGVKLTESGQFREIIMMKQRGDEVRITLQRSGKEVTRIIVIQEIPNDSDGRVGLGIQFEEDVELHTNPKVTFNTEEIGGPSAGLMFTLQIIDQLIEEDVTKGYKIAGTGEILEDGTVGRIGGADFKVIAAAREDVEIFFVPDDPISKEVREANPGIRSNYEEAKSAAERYGTKMKIVPVQTVDDALQFLETLEPKD